MCKNRNRVLDVAKIIYLTMKKMHKQFCVLECYDAQEADFTDVNNSIICSKHFFCEIFLDLFF